mgnify:CR=1 FL=1
MIDSTIFIPLLPRRRGMKILYPRRPRTYKLFNFYTVLYRSENERKFIVTIR